MDLRSRERFVSLLTCTVGQMCKNGLIDSELSVSRVDGLLGITLSSGEVFLVNICESFYNSSIEFDSCHQTSCLQQLPKSLTLSSLPANGRTGRQETKKQPRRIDRLHQNVVFQSSLESTAVQNNPRQGFTQQSVTPSSVEVVEAAYEEVQDDEELVSAFIKVEDNSADDGMQILDNFRADCTQASNGLNFQSKNEERGVARSKHIVVPDQKQTECTTENSAAFDQLCLAADNSNFLTSGDSFAHQSATGRTPSSHDLQPTVEMNVSYDGYCHLQNPTGSCKAAAPRGAVSALAYDGRGTSWAKQHQESRCKNQKSLETRVRWRHHYDANTLRQCIELVRSYKMSQREAERVFQIPRTTIQVKLAQMYPSWVAPPRKIFSKKNHFGSNNPCLATALTPLPEKTRDASIN